MRLSRLIETELEKAELILAAKAIPDKLQDMAEKLATIEADDMMPLLDQLKTGFGPQAADRFSRAVVGKVRELLDEVRSAKDAIDTEINNLEGVANGAPVQTDMNDAMGDQPPPEDDDFSDLVPSNAADSEEEKDDVPSEDDIAAASGVGTADNFAGRAKKESRNFRGSIIKENDTDVKLEADHLRGNRWAVRPAGQLGTMGWSPFPWDVVYVNASSEKDAIRKAQPNFNMQAARAAAKRTSEKKESMTIRGRQIESAIKKLRESKNPDGVVLSEFRSNLTKHSIKEAALRTAKTFRIDLSDVIDIVKEAKEKDKKKKNPFGKKCPPFKGVKSKEEADSKKVAESKSKKMKDDPCWKGYKMVGTKKKDGKEVPNCVKEAKGKKPDADKDGIPDWADKHPFKKGGKEDRKGATPKKKVDEKQLTTAARKGLKSSDFAIHKDGKNKYPIEDKAHARAALSRVSANGTPSEKAIVRRKVKDKFPSMEVTETVKKKASSLKVGDKIVAGKSSSRINRVTHGSRDGRIRVYTGDNDTASHEYDDNETVVVEARNKKLPFKETEFTPPDQRFRARWNPMTHYFDIVDNNGKVVKGDATPNEERAKKLAANFKPGMVIEAIPQGGNQPKTPAEMRAQQQKQNGNNNGNSTQQSNDKQVAADAPEMPGKTLTGQPPKPVVPQNAQQNPNASSNQQPPQPTQQANGQPQKPPTQQAGVQSNMAPNAQQKSAGATTQGGQQTQQTQSMAQNNQNGQQNQQNPNGNKQMLQSSDDGKEDVQPEDGKDVVPSTEKPGFKNTKYNVTMMSTTRPVPKPEHSLMDSRSESSLLKKYISEFDSFGNVTDTELNLGLVPRPIKEFFDPDFDQDDEKPEYHPRLLGYVIRDNRGHTHGCKWIPNEDTGSGHDEGQPKLYADREEAHRLAKEWTERERENDSLMMDKIIYTVGAQYSNGTFRFPA